MNKEKYVQRFSDKKQYEKRIAQLEKDHGYTAMPHAFIGGEGFEPSPHDFVRNQLRGGEKQDGGKPRREIPLLYASSGNEQMQGSENLGTPGLGWMEWGNGNLLPNVVALLTGMLPYTAAGWNFNTKLAASMGPEPMYRFAEYSGGVVSEKDVPFSSAGVLIKGKIRDLRKQIANLGTTTSGEPDGTVAATVSSASAEEDELKADMQAEITQLLADYETWEQTDMELREFLKRTNLSQVYLTLCADYAMFEMCFPELDLNQQSLDANNNVVKTANWQPKVTGLKARPAMICRLERMDKNNRINYVYISNRWLDKPYVETGQAAPEIGALPALSAVTPLGDLEDAVREARQRNVSVKNRPTRFVMPCSFPTVGRPYYPQPSWHSIFGGDIYEFAYTIISDRVTRRKNANIIGRVVYISNEYLLKLYSQKGCTSNDEKQKVLEETFNEINKWLANPDNSGQSLVGFTFLGADGKEHKSFEIVELEGASSDEADANQKELAEVNALIAMAMNTDMKLLGSSPLDIAGSSSGGTDLRERYLLKQIQMAPSQKILLTPLYTVRDFNKWDAHLEWRFKREVLTTLDNSKTGITEQEE